MGKAQEDHTRITGLAEELGLEGDEAGDFISSAMARLGHVAKTIWDDAPPEGGKSGKEGDFFSRGKGGSGGGGERRPVGGNRSGGGGEYRG